MSNILETKIEKVRTEENYSCFDWTIKFKCTCNSCFKGEIKSDTLLECLGLEKLYFTLSLVSPLILGVVSLNYLDNYRIIIGVRNNKNIMCCNYKYKNLKSLYAASLRDVNNRSWYKYKLPQLNLKPSDIQVCNYISEGVLKIAIELFKPIEEVVSSGEKLISFIESDLSRLQKCKTFSDVTLVVGEQEFHLHKAILAMRSTVFYAMFEHEMLENTENKVTIKDISPKVMEQVFNYIYTDAVAEEDCKELVDDILAAADKYNLQGLVKICERIFTEELNIKNVFPILAKANFYKLEALKKIAINFIIENVKNITETNEFENFLEISNLHLLKAIDKQ